MLNLYKTSSNKEANKSTLTDQENLSISYHNLFDYPLTLADLIKWQTTKRFVGNKRITIQNGYYFLKGRGGLIYKRLLRKRISHKKMHIAKKAANIIQFIPTIKMVAVTGSLAMKNSGEESDIDLMIVTKNGTLWTTRALTYLVIVLFGFAKRNPLDKNQKDKLCLNIWLDENDLKWKKTDHNLYTSHEIAQIEPIVNKDMTYEKFLYENKWILKYWPNAVRISNKHRIASSNQKQKSMLPIFIEKVAFRLQYRHMQQKITRETITKTRALFHPMDWGKVVLSRLST